MRWRFGRFRASTHTDGHAHRDAYVDAYGFGDSDCHADISA
jgi:hypothetical protein